MKRIALLWPLLATMVIAACGSADRPRALGTPEWDRVTLPSTAAERIIAIEVREGQKVRAGDVLVRLEPATLEAQLDAATAQERRSVEALAELRAGPRPEEIARARAALAAVRAQAADARAQFERAQALVARQLVSSADVDRARATFEAAAAQVRSAEEALLELQRGTRAEQIAQGEAASKAAEAEVAAQRVLLDKLVLTAPRDGVVDSLPYKLGDQPPIGAPLAVLLTGTAPHARVYIPQALRARIQVGDAATVRVEGDEKEWAGTVRMVRSDPVFTPYYALTGQDAARLSYLAEIQLGTDAANLPAGLPLTVRFGP
ncbi:MAG: hypothetical protein CMLOHMNK_00375 [Steroidobacteraceae bacterium]|nr:hypothetical protein [Steroidobacteraceae bacterium]